MDVVSSRKRARESTDSDPHNPTENIQSVLSGNFENVQTDEKQTDLDRLQPPLLHISHFDAPFCSGIHESGDAITRVTNGMPCARNGKIDRIAAILYEQYEGGWSASVLLGTNDGRMTTHNHNGRMSASSHSPIENKLTVLIETSSSSCRYVTVPPGIHSLTGSDGYRFRVAFFPQWMRVLCWPPECLGYLSTLPPEMVGKFSILPDEKCVDSIVDFLNEKILKRGKDGPIHRTPVLNGYGIRDTRFKMLGEKWFNIDNDGSQIGTSSTVEIGPLPYSTIDSSMSSTKVNNVIDPLHLPESNTIQHNPQKGRSFVWQIHKFYGTKSRRKSGLPQSGFDRIAAVLYEWTSNTWTSTICLANGDGLISLVSREDHEHERIMFSSHDHLAKTLTVRYSTGYRTVRPGIYSVSDYGIIVYFPKWLNIKFWPDLMDMKVFMEKMTLDDKVHISYTFPAEETHDVTRQMAKALDCNTYGPNSVVLVTSVTYTRGRLGVYEFQIPYIPSEWFCVDSKFTFNEEDVRMSPLPNFPVELPSGTVSMIHLPGDVSVNPDIRMKPIIQSFEDTPTPDDTSECSDHTEMKRQLQLRTREIEVLKIQLKCTTDAFDTLDRARTRERSDSIRRDHLINTLETELKTIRQNEIRPLQDKIESSLDENKRLETVVRELQLKIEGLEKERDSWANGFLVGPTQLRHLMSKVSSIVDKTCEKWNDSTTCIICMTNPRTVAFQPCGHMCCCSNCASELHKSDGGPKCPTCRVPFKDTLNVYT